MNLEALLSAERGAQWDELSGKPEATLGRMAILRSLARDLHSRRSKFLAQGAAVETQLVAWEKRLESLLTLREFPDSLGECLNGDLAAFAPVKRTIPKGLFDRLPQEKLERYDRLWEREMTAEAIRLGWSVDKIEAALPAARVEAWQIHWESRSFPRALLLFVESAGPSASDWHGRWWWLSSPTFAWPTSIDDVPLHAEKAYPQP